MYVSAGRNYLTSPKRYFCLLKILSYTSNLSLKSAMCLSKTSLSGIRPFFLIESKQTYESTYMQKVARLAWFIEWKNSLFAHYFNCSLDAVEVKMGGFYIHSLLMCALARIPVGSSGVPWLAYFVAI